MLTLVAIITAPAFAQAWEPHPCTGGDATIKSALANGQPLQIGLTTRNREVGSEASLNAISSSHLAAPGSPPAASTDPTIGDLPRDMWSCTYAATAAMDGDLKTAWVEGAEGPGVGEVLIIPVPGAKAEIALGCSGAPEYFAQNNRPKTVEILTLASASPMALQSGILYSDARVAGRESVTFKDTPDWQPLPFDVTGAPSPDHTLFLAIRLEEVYKGTAYDDTCIAEIREAK